MVSDILLWLCVAVWAVFVLEELWTRVEGWLHKPARPETVLHVSGEKPQKLARAGMSVIGIVFEDKFSGVMLIQGVDDEASGRIAARIPSGPVD